MQDLDQILQSLALKAKSGDQNAFNEILRILDKDIKKLANKYYIVGSDENDVIQECRIGVWKAVKDFDENAGMSFKNFSLNLCCKRHLITAMSHANTQKFKLHNESVSLSAPVSHNDEDGIQTYADYIPDEHSDLLEQYIVREEFDTNLSIISDQLTKLEMSIFNQYALNSSYKDIAGALNVKPKTVDNALMRIRKKASMAYQFYHQTHNDQVSPQSEISVNISAQSETLIGFGTSMGFDGFDFIQTQSSIGFCTVYNV